jgi:hypothetical protein
MSQCSSFSARFSGGYKNKYSHYSNNLNINRFKNYMSQKNLSDKEDYDLSYPEGKEGSTITQLSVNYHEFPCGQKVVRCVSMA